MSTAEERFSKLDLEELLSLLSTTNTETNAIREHILRQATHLIDEVVEESFPQSGFPQKELFHAGYLGLLNAVYNVDLSHGKSFHNYAKNLIKGEIRQHIRDRLKPLEFPRWLQDLNRQMEAAEEQLLQKNGQLPSLNELAEAVNITEEGIAEIFKARKALNYVSLKEEERETDPAPTIDLTKITSKHPDPFPIQHRIRIASALEKLGDLQQFLLKSLFPPAKS
jgi:DNA-directed RNA polymerase specialized sigma subunit